MQKNTIHTINPATEEKIAEYTLMEPNDLTAVLEQTRDAQTEWARRSLEQRSASFRNLAKILRKNKQSWADLMSREVGKTIRDAQAELEKCAWSCEVFADASAAWLKPEMVDADGIEHTVTYEPLGIILGILPWNYPFWQVFRPGLPILMGGNGFIYKHARNCIGSAYEVEKAFRMAGFPNNLVRTIVTSHVNLDSLYTSDLINGVSFTGSTSTGRTIGENAGKNIKKVVLELGGSDPFIVLDDANIAWTARKAAQARTLNNGQSCISSKRFIVMKKAAQDFLSEFVSRMEQLTMGDPLDENSDLGPLCEGKAVEEMEAFVADAKAKGAEILCGGSRSDGSGYFFPPTVLAGATEEMKCAREEVFGPVAPVFTVQDEEEAIQLANSSEFGLGASIWTSDVERGKSIADRLDCGSVFINNYTKSDPRMPMGGIKKSGVGRELSRYGVLEFVNVKALNVYAMEQR